MLIVSSIPAPKVGISRTRFPNDFYTRRVTVKVVSAVANEVIYCEDMVYVKYRRHVVVGNFKRFERKIREIMIYYRNISRGNMPVIKAEI